MPMSMPLMRSAKRLVEVLLVVLLVAGFALFAVQNGQSLVLKFTKYQSPELPLFVVILIAFFLGIVVAVMVGIAEIVRAQARVRRQERQIQTLEKQLTAMKQQPLLESFQSPVSVEGDLDDDERYDAAATEVEPTTKSYPRIR